MADNTFHILDNKAEKFNTVVKIPQLRCIFLLCTDLNIQKAIFFT